MLEDDVPALYPGSKPPPLSPGTEGRIQFPPRASLREPAHPAPGPRGISAPGKPPRQDYMFEEKSCRVQAWKGNRS